MEMISVDDVYDGGRYKSGPGLWGRGSSLFIESGLKLSCVMYIPQS
jgi:hypothetical protein